MEEVILKVEEGLKWEANYGRARMDGESARKLPISPNEIIEIEGKRTTTARVFEILSIDEGKQLIRLDSLMRENAGIELGDEVKVRRATVNVANTVIISPAISKKIQIQFGCGFENFVKRRMLDRPVIKGYIFVIADVSLQGKLLPFVVHSTRPKGVV